MHIAECRFRFSRWLIVWLSSAFVVTPVSADQALPICHMIATGGTIAMKIDPVKNAPVPALSGEDLVASVPELPKIARVRVESLFNIPSGNMDPERWIQIQKSVVKAISSDEVAGVIYLSRNRHDRGDRLFSRSHRIKRETYCLLALSGMPLSPISTDRVIC
jgi:hypothetical protein